MEQLPNDLKNIIKDYIIFKPKNKDELQEALKLLFKNKKEAINKYNDISTWDTSLITDMSNLFERDIFYGDDEEDGDDEKRNDERIWQHERYEKTYERYDEKRIKQIS